MTESAERFELMRNNEKISAFVGELLDACRTAGFEFGVDNLQDFVQKKEICAGVERNRDRESLLHAFGISFQGLMPDGDEAGEFQNFLSAALNFRAFHSQESASEV